MRMTVFQEVNILISQGPNIINANQNHIGKIHNGRLLAITRLYGKGLLFFSRISSISDITELLQNGNIGL